MSNSKTSNEMEVTRYIEFLKLVGNLKHLKRTGWLRHNVHEPETVASHMYRMAMMALIFSEREGVDKFKVLAMAIVHDLAEAIVGDITPFCGVSVDEKHRREDEAMKQMCQLIGSSGLEVSALFEEYEAQQSAEAKFVKDLDRLDLLMQSYEYAERDNSWIPLEEFFTSLDKKISHGVLKDIAEEIFKRRTTAVEDGSVNKRDRT